MSVRLRNQQHDAEVSIIIGGNNAILDASGALFLTCENLLIVSDLHLEKGTSGARRGLFLPPYDSRLTLAALAGALAKYRPVGIVFLGDSFHDQHGPFRLPANELDAIKSMSQACELIWITGNHDPQLPGFLPGSVHCELNIAGLQLTHIPGRKLDPVSQISGHLHPVAFAYGHGRAIRRRCFITDGKRLIMPAFGAYTGGLNIKDKAFHGLFDTDALDVYLLGKTQVYPMPTAALSRSNLSGK